MHNQRTLAVILVWLIVGVLGIQGCSQGPESLATLSPLEPSRSVLATPVVESLPLSSPSPGLAVVRGMIVDSQTQQVPLEGVVYLGNVASMDTGKPVIRLDRETAPFAIPAKSGEFVFQNVIPGEYGLVLYTPDFSFLVDDPQGEGSLIFTVVPDQVLDVGRIKVTMP